MPASKASFRRRRPHRADRAVKIDRELARKAKLIAAARDISMAEYLTEVLRPLVERDWRAARDSLPELAARE